MLKKKGDHLLIIIQETSDNIGYVKHEPQNLCIKPYGDHL